MPKDSETGESYDSPKDALAAALPEGVDAGAVLEELENSGYSVEPSSGTAGLAIGVEAAPSEELPLEEPPPMLMEEELPPEEPPPMLMKEDTLEEEDPIAKKRSKVAEGLMDRFKKDMV